MLGLGSAELEWFLEAFLIVPEVPQSSPDSTVHGLSGGFSVPRTAGLSFGTLNPHGSPAHRPRNEMESRPTICPSPPFGD